MVRSAQSFTPGGEFAFIVDGILHDSLHLLTLHPNQQQPIKWYTSLVSRQETVIYLRKKLVGLGGVEMEINGDNNNNVVGLFPFFVIPLVQGALHSSRCVVAWSFCPTARANFSISGKLNHVIDLNGGCESLEKAEIEERVRGIQRKPAYSVLFVNDDKNLAVEFDVRSGDLVEGIGEFKFYKSQDAGLRSEVNRTNRKWMRIKSKEASKGEGS